MILITTFMTTAKKSYLPKPIWVVADYVSDRRFISKIIETVAASGVVSIGYQIFSTHPI